MSNRFIHTQTRFFGGHLHPVPQLDPLPRVLGEEEVAVEIDVVAEARDLAGGGYTEARLDHAPQHDAEAERTSGGHHAHGLADAAALRELDVDSVRPLRRLADVIERMDVLIYVDR